MVGSHLVDRLVAQGDEILVVDNFATGSRENLAAAHNRGVVSVLDADVVTLTPKDLANQNFDRVYHLASPASPVGYQRRPIDTLMANSVGTRNLLDIAEAHGARFLFASTSEVYGDPLVHPQPENYWGNVNPVGPRSCYDESKRFGESLTINYHLERAVDARIARIFNTYGPRSDPFDGRVIPNFVRSALTQTPITVYGDGSQTRSFCYVTDLVEGMHRLMETDRATSRVVNLGNPAEYNVIQVANMVRDLARTSSSIDFRPLPTNDPTRRQPDISLARELLSWEPSIDLPVGLLKTMEYFQSLPNLRGMPRA